MSFVADVSKEGPLFVLDPFARFHRPSLLAGLALVHEENDMDQGEPVNFRERWKPRAIVRDDGRTREVLVERYIIHHLSTLFISFLPPLLRDLSVRLAPHHPFIINHPRPPRLKRFTQLLPHLLPPPPPDPFRKQVMSLTLFILLTTIFIVEILLILVLVFAYYISYRRRGVGEAGYRYRGSDDVAKASPDRRVSRHCHEDDIEAGRHWEGNLYCQRTLSFHRERGGDEVMTAEVPSSANEWGLVSGMLQDGDLQAMLRELQVRGQEAQRRRLGKQQRGPRMMFWDWKRMNEGRVGA